MQTGHRPEPITASWLRDLGTSTKNLQQKPIDVITNPEPHPTTHGILDRGTGVRGERALTHPAPTHIFCITTSAVRQPQPQVWLNQLPEVPLPGRIATVNHISTDTATHQYIQGTCGLCGISNSSWRSRMRMEQRF